jgi:hypothetical protein
MAMEELEEMEPGFATRSDEGSKAEWERKFYKKTDPVLPRSETEQNKK